MEQPLEEYLCEVKNYRSNEYELSPEKRDLIRHRWANYFEQYGYEESVV